MRRTVSAGLILVMCILVVMSVFAGTSAGYAGEMTRRLNALESFMFKNHGNGIGCGNCPVYAAPSEDAYRGAKGKALVSTTNAEMAEAGFVSGWLLVRYETNNGSYRVGYIPPSYTRGFESDMVPHFDYIPATANKAIEVTDNPVSHNAAFGKVKKGATFYILGRYDYDREQGFEWWYIECTVDGKIARGFIDVRADFSLEEDEEEEWVEPEEPDVPVIPEVEEIPDKEEQNHGNGIFQSITDALRNGFTRKVFDK